MPGILLPSDASVVAELSWFRYHSRGSEQAESS